MKRRYIFKDKQSIEDRLRQRMRDNRKHVRKRKTKMRKIVDAYKQIKSRVSSKMKL